MSGVNIVVGLVSCWTYDLYVTLRLKIHLNRILIKTFYLHSLETYSAIWAKGYFKPTSSNNGKPTDVTSICDNDCSKDDCLFACLMSTEMGLVKYGRQNFINGCNYNTETKMCNVLITKKRSLDFETEKKDGKWLYHNLGTTYRIRIFISL